MVRDPDDPPNDRLVSIVVPTLQRARLLPETLSSLLAQTLPSWEAIVVDDGSTDETESVVREFSRRDPRIRWLKRARPPAGAPACRNIGADAATGTFLVFLDSDDLLAPYCLEQRVEYLQARGDLAYAVFPMMAFKEKPLDQPVLWNVSQPGDSDPRMALARFLARDTPWQTTMPIWRKAAFLRTGGWDEQVSNWQDWEFHIRALLLGLNYQIVAAPPDCFLRRHGQQRISEDDVAEDAVWNKAWTFRKVLSAVRESTSWNEAVAADFARLFLHYGERMAIRDAPWPLVRALLLPLREQRLLGRWAHAWVRAYVGGQKLVAASHVPFVGGGLYRLVRIPADSPFSTPNDVGPLRHHLSERAVQRLQEAMAARVRPGGAGWESELTSAVHDAA